MTREENIARFEALLNSVERSGAKKILKSFIQKTDFYTAPASSSKYGAYEGGLLEKSLAIYDRLNDMAHKEGHFLNKMLLEGRITEDSLIIIGLLNMIYKVNCFTPCNRNFKNYEADAVAMMFNADKTRVQKDGGGNYFWDTATSYAFEDKYPIGAADKSIIFIQTYMKLNWDEIAAIKWSNGASSDGNFFASLSAYPLALALYEAKLEVMVLPKELLNYSVVSNVAEEKVEEKVEEK